MKYITWVKSKQLWANIILIVIQLITYLINSDLAFSQTWLSIFGAVTLVGNMIIRLLSNGGVIVSQKKINEEKLN